MSKRNPEAELGRAIMRAAREERKRRRKPSTPQQREKARGRHLLRTGCSPSFVARMKQDGWL